MAKAEVTLKLSTEEFDLIRECLHFRSETNKSLAGNESVDPATRRDARLTAGRCDDLLRTFKTR